MLFCPIETQHLIEYFLFSTKISNNFSYIKKDFSKSKKENLKNYKDWKLLALHQRGVKAVLPCF